jgi:hypothetical protein
MAQAARERSGRVLVFGEDRIGAGWIGIGIAGAVFLPVAAAQVAAGTPEVLLAVGPVLAVFALMCATTRQVRIDPPRREVLVTRRLLGLRLTRRLPVARFRSVTVRMDVFRPRWSRTPLTPEGDQLHAHYTVALRGWRRLRLTDFHDPVDPPRGREAAEDLARTLGARLGLPAERDGYTVGPGGLSLRRRRPRREPIP